MLRKTVTVLLFLLLSSPAFAHLDAGEDAVVGEYLVDLGYSPENPHSTDELTIALNLVNDSTGKLIEPDKVWVRISTDKEIVFAGNFAPEAGNVVFSYIVPYASKYEITARFFDESGESLVEHSFEFDVVQSPVGGETLYLIRGLLIATIVAYGYKLVRKKK